MRGVESILDTDGDVLDADGVDGGGIDHLGTKVAQLHSLDIAQLVDGVGRLYNLRVGSHEAVHVGPYLQHLGIECSGNDGGGIVAAATPQVGRLMAVTVAGYETGYHSHRRLGCSSVAAQRSKGLAHQTCRQLSIKHVLDTMVGAHRRLLLSADEVAAVHAHATVDETCHDVRRQTLTVAHNGILGLLRKVVNEEHTGADAPQLVEQGIYPRQHGGTPRLVSEDGVYHLVVAVDDGIVVRAPLLAALLCHMGHGDEFVGDAVKGTHHNNDRPPSGFCLNDLLQAKDAWHGTYGRSAEFHYFHSLSDDFIAFRLQN